ncbi:hypothetical protein AAG570_009854 [Ranatra chinensis]|uniref:Uncharacterized protein n=1 Tax=Ranatra chinensis TaxID=642074 RepID=A0ABD0Z133_9HEMI
MFQKNQTQETTENESTQAQHKFSVGTMHNSDDSAPDATSTDLLVSFGCMLVPTRPTTRTTHLFTKLEGFLGGKRFSNDEETVKMWLSEMLRSVFDEGIKKPEEAHRN